MELGRRPSCRPWQGLGFIPTVVGELRPKVGGPIAGARREGLGVTQDGVAGKKDQNSLGICF